MLTDTLDPTDRTPEHFGTHRARGVERYVKQPVRRVAYPLWRFAWTRILDRRFGGRLPFPVDEWLWGQRGNDYQAHRRRVNRYRPLRASDLLIAGCGTGKDVPAWLPYAPATITAVDYFNYARAWDRLQTTYAAQLQQTTLTFKQADLRNLADFAADSFDVIASDALFEHLTDLGAVLSEFYRVLRPSGIVYATFGPLWYAWHGDHISGYDGFQTGFNHLLLDEADYNRYISQLGDFQHSEDDGRTWRHAGFFSYLRPQEYVRCLEQAGFNREYISVLIDPRGVQCLRELPHLRARLLAAHDELTLLVAGMTIIYRKPAVERARHHHLSESVRDL